MRVSLAAICLVFAAGIVHAETTASPPDAAAIAVAAANSTATSTTTAAPVRPTAGTSIIADIHAHDLSAYEAGSPHPIVPSARLTAEVMAALAPPDPSATTAGGTYAAGTAARAATPSAPIGSDAPAVVDGDAKPAASVLDLSPLDRLSGVATGLSTGTRLPVPDDATLSRDTAAAIVRAFHAAPGTADQAASDAADAIATGDPRLDERIGLARTVFKVDGTDELIRHFVTTQMMKVVIGEVAKHIDINKLSDTDKYRLSAIAAAAQTELEDKVLNLDAGVEANFLSKQDLTLLIVAYDTDAERKQTKLRLADTGKADRDAALDITLAQVQIVKAYESGQ